MKVSEVPPGRMHSVEPSATLADVARQMRTADADSVAVMSGGRLVGIVTEHDLVRAIADGVDPKQALAEVVMSANPATVGEDEEVSVVAVKMMRLGIRHLPVLDSAGQPIGLLSARDLVAALEGAT
jgi:CBS domain-containing protein